MNRIATFLIPAFIATMAFIPGNLSNEAGYRPTNESPGGGYARSMFQLPQKKDYQGTGSLITLESLLTEMTDRDRLARFPGEEYLSLQFSSYNRESVAPDKPGWFADSDGMSWIREELNGRSKEYVIMEHEGPGCITRMWTPYFYYGFNNMAGPVVRIYLDGKKEPVIEENFIALLTGNSFLRPPFANFTARAGVCFLPIPYAKSCKITLDNKAFYNIINYRAYPKGQNIRSFTMEQYHNSASLLEKTSPLQ